MIRFAWRQFRFQVIVVSVLLVAVAVVLLVTGPQIAHDFAELKGCKANNDCNYLSNAIQNGHNKILNFATALSLVLPALLGIFWGAPLIAREIESGTYRLAWSQGVTRSKWIITKLSVVGLASMIAAGLMSWMLTWWASPIDTLNANRFSTQVYDTHYVVPIAYAAFAFAVGVTAGVLWRRTLPAMATTLVVYTAVRVTLTEKLRPYLLTPLKLATKLSRSGGYGFEQTPSGRLTFIDSPGNEPNSLVLNGDMVGKHGAALTSQWLDTHCPKMITRGAPVSGHHSVGIKGIGGPVPKAFSECVTKIAANFHQVLTLQPASRFWPFQWIEGGIFLAVAIALCVFSYWWLRKRFA
jgi:hypothetical protein